MSRKKLKILGKFRDRLAFRSWYTDEKAAEIVKSLEQIRLYAERSSIFAKERYVEELLASERYRDPLRLERYGFKVYSQNDEDGIIGEIFNRIGTLNKTFIEFGVDDGLENNTLYLLLQGWRGLWLEGNTQNVSSIRSRFADAVAGRNLQITNAFITRDNINSLIKAFGERDIDLLSIDIDGNDYHVWEAIEIIWPRVVVIEYNAKLRPPLSIVPAYVPDRVWRGDDYMGASLEALVRLGNRKGYSLVGCNVIGLNAFFVRNDLVEGKFHHPLTAENLFQPARYFLYPLYTAGHSPSWGNYVQVPS